MEVEGRGRTYMKEVQIGDRLKTPSGYSRVYSFGHKQQSTGTKYLQIHTAADPKPLVITAAHLLYTYDQDKIVLQPAGAVQVGDTLWSGFGSGATVVSIKVVQRTGLYAPHTMSGNLLVNSVVASTFMALPSVVENIVSFDTQHWLQYTVFAPYRFYCGTLDCKNERYVRKTGFPPFVAALVYVMEGAENVLLWWYSVPSVALWWTVVFGFTLYCVWEKPAMKKLRV